MNRHTAEATLLAEPAAQPGPKELDSENCQAGPSATRYESSIASSTLRRSWHTECLRLKDLLARARQDIALRDGRVDDLEVLVNHTNEKLALLSAKVREGEETIALCGSQVNELEAILENATNTLELRDAEILVLKAKLKEANSANDLVDSHMPTCGTRETDLHRDTANASNVLEEVCSTASKEMEDRMVLERQSWNDERWLLQLDAQNKVHNQQLASARAARDLGPLVLDDAQQVLVSALLHDPMYSSRQPSSFPCTHCVGAYSVCLRLTDVAPEHVEDLIASRRSTTEPEWTCLACELRETKCSVWLPSPGVKKAKRQAAREAISAVASEFLPLQLHLCYVNPADSRSEHPRGGAVAWIDTAQSPVPHHNEHSSTASPPDLSNSVKAASAPAGATTASPQQTGSQDASLSLRSGPFADHTAGAAFLGERQSFKEAISQWKPSDFPSISTAHSRHVDEHAPPAAHTANENAVVPGPKLPSCLNDPLPYPDGCYPAATTPCFPTSERTASVFSDLVPGLLAVETPAQRRERVRAQSKARKVVKSASRTTAAFPLLAAQRGLQTDGERLVLAHVPLNSYKEEIDAFLSPDKALWRAKRSSARIDAAALATPGESDNNTRL